MWNGSSWNYTLYFEIIKNRTNSLPVQKEASMKQLFSPNNVFHISRGYCCVNRHQNWLWTDFEWHVYVQTHSRCVVSREVCNTQTQPKLKSYISSHKIDILKILHCFSCFPGFSWSRICVGGRFQTYFQKAR